MGRIPKDDDARHNWILNEIEKELARADEERDTKLRKLAEKYVKKLTKDSYSDAANIIYEWYGTYKPKVYGRTLDLYNAVQTEANGTSFSFETDSSLMKNSHDVSNDIVYNVAFEQGYHGGTPDEHLWIFDNVIKGIAPQSFSPDEEIQDRWEFLFDECQENLNSEEEKITKKIKERSDARILELISRWNG